MADIDLRRVTSYEDSDDEEPTLKTARLKKTAISLLSRGEAGRFREREERKAKRALDPLALQLQVKEAESAVYAALSQVRMRYRQTKLLLADVMDSVDAFITSTVTFSKQRLMLMERLQVAYLGFAGTDEAISLTTEWSGKEDEAIVSAMEALRDRFDEAVELVLGVNDAIDTRLLWIDGLGAALVQEKSKWKKNLKATSKAVSHNTPSVERLAGVSEDMIKALAALEVGIGSFVSELDSWTTHSKDVFTPCFVELIRSFSVMSRDEFQEPNRQAIRGLLAVQNEVEGLRSQTLTTQGPGGVYAWPKLRAILRSPLQKQYYANYLESRHNVENLLFIEAVDEFRIKAAGLECNCSKIRALAQPLMKHYVDAAALHQINIEGRFRERLKEQFRRKVSLDMFDEAYTAVWSMMDRDVINFRQSPLAQDMVRRLSHDRIVAERHRILRPTTGVVLKLEPIPSTEADVDEDTSLSNSDGLQGSRRRLGGSLVRRAKTARRDSDPPRSGLLSPRGRRASSARGRSSSSIPPLKESSDEGSRTPTLPRLTLVDKGSASPTSARRDSARTNVVSLEDALARSPREETPISPRELLRSGPRVSASAQEEEVTPTKKKKGSRRTQQQKQAALKAAGKSTKGKALSTESLKQ